MKDKHDLELYFVSVDTVMDDIDLLIQKLEYLSIKDLYTVMIEFEKRINDVFGKYTVFEHKQKTFKKLLGEFHDRTK